MMEPRVEVSGGRMRARYGLVVAALLVGVAPLRAQTNEAGPVWPKLSQADRAQVMRFGEDFKSFLGRAKSEMTFVREAVKLLDANGFKAWPATAVKGDVRPGSRWYAVNRDRTIAAFVIGTEPV